MTIWEKGNLTINKRPHANDKAKCEYCGHIGSVGREVFISWGMVVTSVYCRKECERKGGEM